jgi:hypothetical protein
MHRALKQVREANIDHQIIVIDSTGLLPSQMLPGAVVEKFVNLHPLKLDYFFRHYLGSELVLVSDDDSFLFNSNYLYMALKSFESRPRLAAYSFYTRKEWQFNINGKRISPIGIYSVIYNREIITQENLRFNITKQMNPHNQRCYDSGDYLNEMLLRRGYEVLSLPEEIRSQFIGGFTASSMHRIFQWGFSRDDLSRYFTEICTKEYDTRIVYIINSFYTATKISKLYEKIYNINGSPPVISELDWHDFLDKLPDNRYRMVLTNNFMKIDSEYERNLSFVNSSC